ncbi:hypothetical protein D3C71_635610 [compost metagenome]
MMERNQDDRFLIRQGKQMCAHQWALLQLKGLIGFSPNERYDFGRFHFREIRL